MPTKETPAEARANELLKALAHPWRTHMLHILARRPIASPKEMALEIGVDVTKLGYHVRELLKFDCIELVKTEQRRGATEHFYRATRRAFFDDAEWIQLPEQTRAAIVTQQLLATGRIISAAMAAGTFEERGDRHHSLIEFDVDETGWAEAMAIMAEAEERIVEVKATSAERLLEDDSERIPVAVSMLGFERAPK